MKALEFDFEQMYTAIRQLEKKNTYQFHTMFTFRSDGFAICHALLLITIRRTKVTEIDFLTQSGVQLSVWKMNKATNEMTMNQIEIISVITCANQVELCVLKSDNYVPLNRIGVSNDAMFPPLYLTIYTNIFTKCRLKCICADTSTENISNYELCCILQLNALHRYMRKARAILYFIWYTVCVFFFMFIHTSSRAS